MQGGAVPRIVRNRVGLRATLQTSHIPLPPSNETSPKFKYSQRTQVLYSHTRSWVHLGDGSDICPPEGLILGDASLVSVISEWVLLWCDSIHTGN